MKIAIASTGKDLSDEISEMFGRCPYFIIAEIKDGKAEKIEALKNESADQSSGAGMSAAKLMAEKNVKAVVAKNVGPRSMEVLNQFGIKTISDSGKISEVLQRLEKQEF